MIDRIPQDVILANADPADADGDGIQYSIDSGNPDAGEADENKAAEGMVSETELGPEGNSGNPDAESDIPTVNLQQITLADCEAAGM